MLLSDLVLKKHFLTSLLTLAVLGLGPVSNAGGISRAEALEAVSAAVLPAMERNRIPGMAVALVAAEETYVFNYGLSDVAKQIPVSDETIFEIGSISKTFTSTLATYAEAAGYLKLTDTTETYLPDLADTAFGKSQLFHLGTHTVGGIPLQVPDTVRTRAQLLEYFRTWKPIYEVGTMRTYANPSIGALGWIAAKSLGQDFSTAMTQLLFQPLGLVNTYLRCPQRKSHVTHGATPVK
jgi:Beta-lactamase class C and other penicillin binding proteins